MSASIRSPWICDYLINIAETHGGSLSSASPEPKAKKAQLVKFLTFPRSDNEDACIWVLLSDKTHVVPACLNSEAMKLYRQNPQFSGKSVTDHRSALVFVKHFRPLFRRVPLEGKGMSLNERLVLDIGSFALQGSFGEDLWGSPKELESNADIREWIAGLREHGGGGNVLKLRKQEQEKADAEAADVPERTVAVQRIIPLSKARKEYLSGAGKITLQKPPPSHAMHKPALVAPPREVDPKREWYRGWRVFPSKARVYAQPPADVLNTLRKLASTCKDGPEATEEASHPSMTVSLQNNVDAPPISGPSTPRRPHYRSRRNLIEMSSSPAREQSANGCASPRLPDVDEDVGQPATPSHWSPSVRGSPSPSIMPQTNTNIEDPADDKGTDRPATEKNSPKNIAPKVQNLLRESSPVPETDLPLPNTSSSYLSAPTPAQRVPRPIVSSSPLPNRPSSPPASLPVASAPSSSALPPASTTLYPPLSRRVPLLHHSPEARLSDPGRILVPNSDASGTASQGRSQQSLSYTSASQDKAKGQSQSKTDTSSQPHSQLRNEVQPSPQSDMLLPPLTEGADGPEKALSSRDAEPSSQSVQREPERDTAPVGEAGAAPSERQSSPPPLPVALEEAVSPTEDDDADDEMELDELDPDSDSGLAQPGGTQHIVDVSMADELDSDDERTRAMVESHMSAAQQSPAAVPETSPYGSPAGSGARTSPEGSAQAREKASRAKDKRTRRALRSSEHGESSDGPLRPSSPDVFISEASFHASQEQNSTRVKTRSHSESSPSSGPKMPPAPPRSSSGSARGSTSTPAIAARRKAADTVTYTHHDPGVWAAPTFMNKDKGRAEVQTMQPPKVVVRTESARLAAAHKRRISTVSSPEQRPLKKQKMSTEPSGPSAASSEKPADRQADHRPAVASGAPSKDTAPQIAANDSASSRPAEPPRRAIDLRRSASTASSASSARRRRAGGSTRSSSSKPEIRMVKTTLPGTSTPTEIPHITFPTSGSSSLGQKARARAARKTAARPGPGPPRTSSSETSGTHLRAIPEPAGHADAEAAAPPGSAVSSGSGTSDLGDAHASGSRAAHPGAVPAAGNAASRTGQTRQAGTASGASSSRGLDAASSDVTGLRPGASASWAHADTVPAGSAPRLLGGYSMSYDLVPVDNGPALCTWRSLEGVLLDTGRARFQASKGNKQQSKSGRTK